MKIQIWWFTTGWLILFFVSQILAAQTDRAEKDLVRKRKELEKITRELSATRKKEKEATSKEASVLESLSSIENELYRKGKELKRLEEKLNEIVRRRQEINQQIALLSEGIDVTKRHLWSRLNALYRMDRVPRETYLFAAQSFHDLLRLDKYLRTVVDFDARILKEHRSQVELKEKYQEALIREQWEWQRAISEVAKKRAEIKKTSEEKRALLKSIQREKATYQKLIAELGTRARELQAFIERLEKEKSQFAHGKPRPDFRKADIIAPVQGKVISLFKERGQNGIEISAPAESEIRAILGGRILYAGWFKGFGNVVVIDHGGNLFSVYGYISQLLKKEGDIVSRGETIALVGSAGSLKGPCLYFEIRHRGKPEDPLAWLPGMERVVSLSGDKERGKKEL